MALLAGLGLPRAAAAQTRGLPPAGQPGFANGIEGFFVVGGHRTLSGEHSRPQVMQSSRVSRNCRMLEGLAIFSMTKGGRAVNNVSLRPATDPLSDTLNAELSVSLFNCSTEPCRPTIQVIVYDTTSPLPALLFSTEPLISISEERATEQISQNGNTRPGELDMLFRFCLRIKGWGGQNPWWWWLDGWSQWSIVCFRVSISTPPIGMEGWKAFGPLSVSASRKCSPGRRTP